MGAQGQVFEQNLAQVTQDNMNLNSQLNAEHVAVTNLRKSQDVLITGGSTVVTRPPPVIAQPVPTASVVVGGVTPVPLTTSVVRTGGPILTGSRIVGGLGAGFGYGLAPQRV